MTKMWLYAFDNTLHIAWLTDALKLTPLLPLYKYLLQFGGILHLYATKLRSNLVTLQMSLIIVRYTSLRFFSFEWTLKQKFNSEVCISA